VELKGGKALLKSIECNMSAHEYIYYVLEFDLNNQHVLTEEKIWKVMVVDISEDMKEAALV
jgi:hypothetical protein